MHIDNPQTFSVDQVFKALETSKEGLSQEQANLRLAKFGKNLVETKQIHPFFILVRQFKSILIFVLCLAALISLFMGRFVEFWTIVVIILINGFLGFWQELKALKSMEGLKTQTKGKVLVLRDQKKEEIPPEELVVGDIVYVHEGDVIYADMHLVESNSLQTDEANVTGESYPVDKNIEQVSEDVKIFDQKCLLFATTFVVKGSGIAVVVKTAEETFVGKTQTLKIELKKTPLNRALFSLAKRFSLILLFLLIVIGVVAFLQQRELMHVLYILVAELVSFIPEGLPIVVTLVLVTGALFLSTKKTLIKYLPAVETLGSTTWIASDKTGTITKGVLEVKEVAFKDEKKARLIAALCNEHNRDPVDHALREWVENFDQLRQKHPRIWVYPFDSKQRLMATLNKVDEKETLFVKGSFEKLKKMTQDSSFDEKHKEMAEKGLRVLAFGMGQAKSKDPKDWEIEFIGLVGFLDVPKANVLDALNEARAAGIKVMMLTGDHPKTAKTVAEEIGLFKEGDTLLLGEDIEHIDTQTLFEMLQNTKVIARILPEAKYKVVNTLQAHGEIVAVTGDGVNDIPALKAADLGIAMGSSQEATKAVSKMVIMDNNLQVIVEAIRYGRIIANNIRKVIYYLFSSSLIEMSLISLAIFSGLPLPLTPLQILWINIVTDGVQDKAFAFAKEEGNVMEQKPKKPTKQFFDAMQIFNILFFGLIMGGLTYFLFVYLLKIYTYKKALTIVFTCVAASQWFNGVQAQKEKEPFFYRIKQSFTINPSIFLGIGLGFLLQLLAVNVFQEGFSTVALSFNEWLFCFGFASIAFFVIEIRKWMMLFFSKRK
ncbi:MAG: Calcium-transporting ATPase 1 [Chlamydiae bacterium]|nr:Calcium-transporting ATPase 1 [Chlamydiota bacterium]